MILSSNFNICTKMVQLEGLVGRVQIWDSVGAGESVGATGAGGLRYQSSGSNGNWGGTV